MSDCHDLTLSIISYLLSDRRSDANTILTQIRKARDVGVAYNGRSQRPGQLWAARAGQGREKERLGPGPGQAGRRKRKAGPRPGPSKKNAPNVRITISLFLTYLLRPIPSDVQLFIQAAHAVF